MTRNEQIIAQINELEATLAKKEKLFVAPENEKQDAREKRLEARRKWRLNQLGGNADNYVKTHTLEDHLAIRTEYFEKQIQVAVRADEEFNVANNERIVKEFEGWRTQSDRIVENYKIQEAIRSVKQEERRKALLAKIKDNAIIAKLLETGDVEGAIKLLGENNQ